MNHWPTLVNKDKCIEKYMHEDADQCIFIVQRHDGTFSICGFKRVEGYQGEMVWTVAEHRYSIYNDKNALLKDMNISQPWTKNVAPSYNT